MTEHSANRRNPTHLRQARLQTRSVHVRALVVPLGAWQADLSYEAGYREMVTPVLDSRDVAVTDLSGFLRDEEFMDGIYARYSGQRRLHERTRALAVEALAEMGGYPDSEEIRHVR